MQLIGVALILFFARGAVCQTLRPGPCPNATIQSDFDDSAFAGRWFEFARTPRLAEADGKCVFFEVIPPENGRIIINRRLVSSLTNQESYHSAEASVVGPGEATADGFDFRVLGTDYDNFAVIYACRNLITRLGHIEMLWGLTRDPFPDPKYPQEAHKIIDANGINRKHLNEVDQKDCPPPPNEPLPTDL